MTATTLHGKNRPHILHLPRLHLRQRLNSMRPNTWMNVGLSFVEGDEVSWRLPLAVPVVFTLTTHIPFHEPLCLAPEAIYITCIFCRKKHSHRSAIYLSPRLHVTILSTLS